MTVTTVSLIKYSTSSTEYNKLLSFSGLSEVIHIGIAIFSRIDKANHIIREMGCSANVWVMN